jgi:UDP-N-acetylenolpyruvoylglucosamine reductase
MTDFETLLRGTFGDRVQSNVPLAPMTTFRVGGPAEWLVETRGRDELVAALQLADKAGVSVTMLGGGSNVLVNDAGVRGLVIRPRGGDVRDADDGQVIADAAMTINGLVRWTINHGRAGLEAWAGTPGTVGGAIFGNAHFGGRLIGDLVDRVQLATRAGVVKDVAVADMAFGYDRSRLQTTGEILLSAVFRDRAAVARVSQAHPAARHAERRLHFPESRTGPRRGARGHSVLGGRTRRSRRPQRRCRRRRARLANARQLHRQRRIGHRRRHPSADRNLPHRGPRALRRRAAGRNRLFG